MLIAHLILAALAVGALALRPRSALGASVVATAALADVSLGASAGPALAVVVPLTAFLAAALTLAALVESSGLAGRMATGLAATARGNALALYGLVCLLCGLLTAAVSLDGAVVLMVPVLLALNRRFGAPFAPLFLGTVVVANAASIAVPQGNPTNLVVIDRLGLSPAGFLTHMFVPGITAAAVCAIGVAWLERRALTTAIGAPARGGGPRYSVQERHAAVSLAGAALAAWTAPLLGVAPWWPFSGAVVVALALRGRRSRLTVPWRVATQVGGLLVVTQALDIPAPAHAALGLPGLVVLAAGIGVASAVANNLPVSAWAATLLASGQPAYAASIGLAVGSLATPQGSVATLIAADLAGARTPSLALRRLGPLAAGGVAAAIVTLWALS